MNRGGAGVASDSGQHALAIAPTCPQPHFLTSSQSCTAPEKPFGTEQQHQ